MTKRKATEEELREVWQGACEFWKVTDSSNIDFPWVEARFKLSIFKITLAQKGLSIPPSLGIL